MTLQMYNDLEIFDQRQSEMHIKLAISYIDIKCLQRVPLGWYELYTDIL